MNHIYGYASTPTSTLMTSLTAELYGLISTILCVHLISTQQNLYGKENWRIVIVSDNKEDVQMGGGRDPPMNISNTLKAEYDLGQLLREMINLLPGTIHLQWIKGHQDELNCGQNIAGPFLRPVQLNIEMDKLVTKGVHVAQGKVVRRAVYSTTWMWMYTNNGVFIDDIRTHLQHEYLGQTLRQYLQQKYNWDNERFVDIDWEGVENILSGYRPCYRNRIAQLIHIGNIQEIEKR